MAFPACGYDRTWWDAACLLAIAIAPVDRFTPLPATDRRDRNHLTVSQANLDTWPSGLSQIAHRADVSHYGHPPPSMFNAIKDAFMERWNAKPLKRVNRAAP